MSHSPLSLLASSKAEPFKPHELQYGIDALVHLNQIERADVLIRLPDGGCYPAHKAYLNRSNHFASHANFAEQDAKIIYLDLPVPHHFRPFLEHIYADPEIVDPRMLTKEVLYDTLLNAIYLDMEHVVSACKDSFPQHYAYILTLPNFHHTTLHITSLTSLLSTSHLTARAKWECTLHWARGLTGKEDLDELHHHTLRTILPSLNDGSLNVDVWENLCESFPTTFHIHVHPSFLICLSRALLQREREAVEREARREVERLKSLKVCRRCGGTVTVAEVESGARSCIAMAAAPVGGGHPAGAGGWVLRRSVHQVVDEHEAPLNG
ncbi:hypothetical protein HDV05_001492 [Chytridiales sp. JEL 0842]|nr:hypothetical protein HDV05_001492 [Chytridiales sp. JEL 0842]